MNFGKVIMRVFATLAVAAASSATAPRAQAQLVLLVSDANNDSVKRYDGVTGDFIDDFIPTGSGGPDVPQGLVFGSDGNLYVSSALGGFFDPPVTRDALRFDGTTGALIDQFVTRQSGALNFPTFLTFSPEPAPTPGDIDGAVDEVDQAIFVAVLPGLDTDPLRISRSDLNGDRDANGGDIRLFVAARTSP